jgi:hypothetical protein
MRTIGSAMVLAIAASAAAVVADSETSVCGADYGPPVDFIAASYERLQGSGSPPAAGGVIYTGRLNALFDESADRLGFGFWVDGQDWLIDDVSVTGRDVWGREDRRVVEARFTNFGEPRDLRFYFDRTREGCWQIDDVAGDGWTLSLLLKYPA